MNFESLSIEKKYDFLTGKKDYQGKLHIMKNKASLILTLDNDQCKKIISEAQHTCRELADDAISDLSESTKKDGAHCDMASY